jgi:hypothetical protein
MARDRSEVLVRFLATGLAGRQVTTALSFHGRWLAPGCRVNAFDRYGIWP